jgi:predicted DNA-binding transcriptional regulator AlpA
MDDEFVPPATVQEITGVSIAALAQLRHRGQGPRYYKPTARIVLYKRSEVLAWVESSVRSAEPEFA